MFRVVLALLFIGFVINQAQSQGPAQKVQEQDNQERDLWRERLAKAEEAQAAALCFEVLRKHGTIPDRCAPFLTKVKQP